MPSPGTSGGRVRVYIDGDAADLERAVKQSNSALSRLGIGQQNLSTKTKLANAVADQQRRNLSAIATGAKYAAGGLAVFAGAGLVKATTDGIRFNAQMESSELALKNLLGGSQEAKKYLDDLYETAKQTPFEFTDLTEASRRLISFGLDAEKTKRVLNATGDAVAAMGGSAENIDRVTLALGQMQAKGKVSAEELLQLTEAGIPAYKILQDELGLTGDQIADIGNQGIKADAAIDALTRGMEDRFGGMAAKQAKTWDGLTSTMKDNWAQMTGAMTTDLFGEAKQWAPKVNETMEDITAIFERSDLSFDEKVQKSVDAIDVNLGPLADEIGHQLDDAELGEHLIDAVDWAIPRVAEHAGTLGVEVAEGLAKGFIHADPLGKAVITASVIRMLGGNAAFGIIGGTIWKKVFAGAAAKTAASTTVATGAGEVFGTTAGGAAAGGLTAKFGSFIRSPAFLKGLGVAGAGIAIGDALGDSAARQAALRGDDVTKALEQHIPSLDSFGAFSDGPGLIESVFGASEETKHAQELLGVLKGIAEEGKAISDEDAKRLMHESRFLDLSEEQKKQAREILQIGERRQDQLQRLAQTMGTITIGPGQRDAFNALANSDFTGNVEAMQRGFFTTLASMRKASRENMDAIATNLGRGSEDGRAAMAANYRAMAANVERMNDRGLISDREAMKKRLALIEKSRLVEATEDQARQMAKTWNNGLNDQEQYTKKHVDDVLDKLNRMPPQAAKAASQTWLGQLRIAAQNNPKLQDEFRDLRSKIVDELGIAAVRGTKKAQDLQAGVGGSYRNTSWIGGKALGVLAENTSNFLTGVDQKPLDFTLKDVAKGKSPFQRGGAVRLQGGGDVFQVPGTGTGDSFHTVVPPNSFVLNREAVGEFIGLQRGGVPVVLEPGELVFGPEAVAQMGGWLQWANDEKPRFATGGSGIQQALGPYDMPPVAYDPNHAGGNSHLHLDFFTVAQALAYGHKMQGMGWNISEYTPKGGNPWGFGGISTQHQSPGHYDGTAFDANTAADETRAEVAAVVRLLGGKGISVAAAQKLKRVLIDGPDGVMKGGAQAASDKAWKAASAYLRAKTPTDMGVGSYPADGTGKGVANAAGLPASLQKYNQRYEPHWAPDYGGYVMPARDIAKLAEWAGRGRVPGWTMQQVTVGESGGRPGSAGVDPGGTKGYGLWAITSPFANNLVSRYGGYEAMWNPVANAQVMAAMYPTGWSGGSPWYGTSHVSDYNKHYTGKMARGGFVGARRLAGGGDSDGKKTDGKWSHSPMPPPSMPLPGGMGAKPGDLTYEQKMTVLGIALTGAEETPATEDDLKILYGQMRLIQGELDAVNDGLSNLHLTKADRAKARRQALHSTADLEKKLGKGGFTEKELARLKRARERAAKQAGGDILSERRDELLDRLSSLTGEMASTKDSIESLNESANETLTELAESMASLATEMAEHNDLISRNQGVSNAELVRALADLLDGEIGGRVDAFSNTAGYGQVVAA